jgi:hypothetical protein
MACDRKGGKGPGRGQVFPGKDRRGLAAGWGLAMLHPMLSASSESVDERFPCRLRRRQSFLFMFFGRNSISMASFITRSMYVALVERMAMSCSLMRQPRLVLCSATADLSGYFRLIWRLFSLTLAAMERLVCQMPGVDLAALAGQTLHTWRLEYRVVF